MKQVITLCPKCGRPLFKGEIMCPNCLCLKTSYKLKETKIKRNKVLTKVRIINNIKH